jgi:hypothetical protein
MRKSRKIIAHFNPEELNILEHLQGHRETCKRSGLRSYNGLEALLSNPHVAASAHHHGVHHQMASGGHVTLPEMASEGRHGDSELALIGPHTRRFLDTMAAKRTKNPETGHPEYWSIGSALNGLWNTVKSGASQIYEGGKNALSSAREAAPGVLKGIGRAAMPAIQQMAADKAGQYLGKKQGKALAGAVIPGLSRKLLGEGPVDQTQKAIGGGLGRAAQAYRGGQSGRQALGAGLGYTGSKLGGGVGEGLRGMGRGITQGQGSSIKQGARRMYESLGGANRMRQALGEGLMSDNPSGYAADSAASLRNRMMPGGKVQPQEGNPNTGYEGDYGEDMQQMFG